MSALQPRRSVQPLQLPAAYRASTGARNTPTPRPPPRAELRAVLERAQLVGATGTDTAVLAALWTHADRHGGCWPSQARLAALTGRCERTVRTSVQRLSALGLIVRAVPAPSSRRWGWTDPATGKRRSSRRTTTYTLTCDVTREPRPAATIGANAEPSPDITMAIARVEAAHAAAVARADAPELLWCGVDVVDLAVADAAVDLVVADDVAELELVTGAPSVGDPPAAFLMAPVMPVVVPVVVEPASYLRGPFVPPVDRQRLPPKRPDRNQSARARATATAATVRTIPVLGFSVGAIARAQIPRSPVRAVDPPRPATVRAVADEPPQTATAAPQRAPDGLPPELVQRLRGLVARRR